MSKFFKYNLIAFCSCFISMLTVSAGVCEGMTVANPTDGTCNSSKIYKFERYLHDASEGYSIYKTLSGYSYSGDEEYALCIDPGKNAPYNGSNHFDYNYTRDIETTGNDLYFYRIYQKYVNAVGYSFGDRDTYLKYVDIMSRYLIHHGIPGWSLYGSTYDKNKLLNNTDAKAFYDAAMAMTLWENPLNFETSVTYDTNEEMYIFKIDVKFTNDSSQYFFTNTSGLINGDYNIGYGDAFFEYEFQINDGAYSFGNAYSYTGNISGNINKWMSNPNNTLSFEMKMKRDIYDEIYNAQGKVYLNLKYSTYNAMSDENVIFVKRHAADSTNQRMLVFTKYIKNGNILIDGEDNEEVFSSPLCKQVGNDFYYDNTLINIEEYKEKCGCGAINTSLITNTGINSSFNSLCGLNLYENYSSTMNSCDSDSGTNNIGHDYTRKINVDNNYCDLNCVEKIDLNDLTDKYSVLAGKYYELDKYPNLNSSKTCELNVYYDKWNTDYKKLLEDEIKSVNSYLRDVAIENPYDSKSISCSCGEDCTDYGTRWYYKYKLYKYNSSSREITFSERKSSYKTGSCGDTKPSTNISGHLAAINTRISEITTNYERLRNCNKYLDDLGDDYYKFSGDLSFYYEQTYSKYGNLLNNNKPGGEDDDSTYKINLKNDSGYNLGYKEESGTNYNSTEYTVDSYYYVYISGVSDEEATVDYTEEVGSEQEGDYVINRKRNYACDYEPSVPKFVDSFTGLISSNKSSLYNPVSIIGDVKTNVYDTDISAVAYNANRNYYQFSKLGDDNEIGEHYNLVNVEKLKRYCKYAIINPIIEGCDDGTCQSKLNTVFRIVDPNNLDPNGRLGSDGFKNWDNKKGRTVLETIQNADTYNPDNLEYSFTLDSATIKKIKEYNSNCDGTGSCEPRKYSSTDPLSTSTLSCNEVGNECTSAFIDELYETNGDFGKNVATNIGGREKWKYLMYNSFTDKWSIVETSMDDTTFKSLITQYKSLGVDVTP